MLAPADKKERKGISGTATAKKHSLPTQPKGKGFSEKEKVIIQDVHRKNFWFKALPLSLGCMVGCRVLMTKGYISTKWGLPKVLGCGFAGYLLGKINTVTEIRDRLLTECPDGLFAQTYNMPPAERNQFLTELAQNVRKMPQRNVNEMYGKATQPVDTSTSTESTSTSPLPFSGGENLTESSQQEPGASNPTQEVFSYAKQRAKLNKSDTGSPSQPQSSQPEFSYAQRRRMSDDSMQPSSTGSIEESPPDLPGRKVRRNKYGDEME